MLVRTAPMTGPSVEEVKARLRALEEKDSNHADSQVLRDALAVIDLLQKENKDAFDRGIICADLSHATLEAEIASLRARLSRIEGAIALGLPRLRTFLRDKGHRPLERGEEFRECCPACFTLWELDQALTEGEAK